MKKEDKAIIIREIEETIKAYNGFYLVETAGLNAEKTSELRRACFNADIKLVVVKNKLLRKALENLEGDYSELYPALKESTSLMSALSRAVVASSTAYSRLSRKKKTNQRITNKQNTYKNGRSQSFC